MTQLSTPSIGGVHAAAIVTGSFLSGPSPRALMRPSAAGKPRPSLS